ncbi:hypothetical protein K0T92_12630 [Paenibacillus oenotherae]|uniref:Uncharacterized protein n=1 Tax=Paenibacillus oenotherae TaxID=1435645 RepID=A0ABS7D7T3_9BACL|nr:hypothetical protein [Paenibacillus oenotherae]MBW7475596.1 hypothetical protein [Paenibacillus oenotherae]
MGVKHAREYEEILAELTEAIHAIGDGYTFFDMGPEDWAALSAPEQKELMQTLADDLFFGLGEDAVIEVGSGTITYRPKHHCIEVSVDGTESRIIRLV